MSPSRPEPAALALSLFAVARRWDDLAQAVVNRELGLDLARPALMRLLPWLEAGPIRLTDLARRADVSKQAVGQALRGPAALGLVAYAPDPRDGRATLVRLTAKGRRSVEHGRAVLQQVEDRLAKDVGTERMRALRRDLAQLEAVLARLTANDIS